MVSGKGVRNAKKEEWEPNNRGSQQKRNSRRKDWQMVSPKKIDKLKYQLKDGTFPNKGKQNGEIARP